MLGHYLRIGWRHLFRNQLYALINVIGHSTGMACCQLIYLFIVSEFSFDRVNARADRIYRPALREDYSEGQIGVLF